MSDTGDGADSGSINFEKIAIGEDPLSVLSRGDSDSDSDSDTDDGIRIIEEVEVEPVSVALQWAGGSRHYSYLSITTEHGDGSHLIHEVVFHYLQALFSSVKKEQIKHVPLLKRLFVFFEAGRDYSPTVPYTAFYKLLLAYLQTEEALHAIDKGYIPDSFIIALYENDNHALERTTEWLAARSDATENRLPTVGNLIRLGVPVVRGLSEPRMEVFIAHLAANPAEKSRALTFDVKYYSQLLDHLYEEESLSHVFDVHNPVDNQSKGARARSVAADYQPMLDFNVPSIRRYHHTLGVRPCELRFGTQAEVVAAKGGYRVNPIFVRYLQAKAMAYKKKPDAVDPPPILHVYINNLKRGGGNFEREREGLFTEELEALEKMPGIAVITLPADEGLLDQHLIEAESAFVRCVDRSVAARELINLVLKNGKDCFISPNIRKLLFASQKEEAEGFLQLIEESLRELGFTQKYLSPSEAQALSIHFFKYKLTAYILKKLNPETFNISCKDAIDRGGIHSLYYNLVTSIERGTPMTEAEFAQAVLAAPTLVKGRGMNGHANMLTNMLHYYVKAAKARKAASPESTIDVPEWLERYLQQNDPVPKAFRQLEAQAVPSVPGKAMEEWRIARSQYLSVYSKRLEHTELNPGRMNGTLRKVVRSLVSSPKRAPSPSDSPRLVSDSLLDRDKGGAPRGKKVVVVKAVAMMPSDMSARTKAALGPPRKKKPSD